MTTNSIPNNADILQTFQAEKLQVRQEIEESRMRMSKTLHGIVGESQDTAGGRKTGVKQMVSSGIAIYEGIKISYSIFSALRSLFKRKRRR